MGFAHIIIEFEKDGKNYSFYKTDIPNREYIEGCIDEFKNKDIVCFCGFKINTTICLPKISVYISNDKFDKSKEKEKNTSPDDAYFIKHSKLFTNVTEDYKINFLNGFKVFIK